MIGRPHNQGISLQSRRNRRHREEVDQLEDRIDKLERKVEYYKEKGKQMARQNARKDDNQDEIVERALALGCSVWLTHQIGNGGPDIVVGIEVGDKHFNMMCELKDGSKSPSQQKLSDAEEKFHKKWKGQICIINSVQQMTDLVIAVKRGDHDISCKPVY